MKAKYILWAMAVVTLLGCATVNNLFPTETLIPTNTLIPTSTAAPSATPEPILLGQRQYIPNSPASFQPPVGYDIVVDQGLAVLTDGEMNISHTLVTGLPEDQATSETLLFRFIANYSTNPATESLELGPPFKSTLAGLEAKGMDFNGLVNQFPMHGRAIASIVNDALYIVAFSIALDDEVPGDRWESEAETVFTAVIDSVEFDVEEQQSSACVVSDDDSYGYSEENPIRVGGDVFDGPPRARAFLDNLLGPNGEVVSYERGGSIPTADTILDTYSVEIAGGETLVLYVDQYSYSEPFAPVGFTCSGAFPLSAP